MKQSSKFQKAGTVARSCRYSIQ